MSLGTDRQHTFERVTKILKNMLKITPGRGAIGITMQSDLYKDLGVDSLETLDLLNGLEEEFGVNPDQYEAVSKRTISEIVDYIIELQARQKVRLDNRSTRKDGYE